MFGSPELISHCRETFDGIMERGTPGQDDVVITDESLEAARMYLPARVFLVNPPSLALWRAATGSGVTVAGSPVAVASKLGVRISRTKGPAPQPGRNVRSTRAEVAKEIAKEEKSETATEGVQEPDIPISCEINEAPESKLPDLTKRATIIAVYSLKGGVGKTTLSMNLAAVLRRHGHAVCLVDLDIKTGSATSYLFPNSRPAVDIVSWDEFPLEKAPDKLAVESFLASGPAGMHVLPSPEASYQANVVTNRLTGMALDILSAHFDYIVVDMAGGALEHRERKALSMADVVFLLATPDEMSISGAVRTVDQVVGPGKPVDPSRVRFIVNRDRPRAPRRPEEVARMAGLELSFVIPEDGQAIDEAAFLQHTLPVLLKKNSLLKESIENLAGTLVPGFNAAPHPKGGLLSRLRSFFKKLIRKGEKRSEKSLAHAG